MKQGVIEVYRDWDQRQAGDAPRNITRAGRTGELFDFTFDDAVLADATLAEQTLDPDLSFFCGTAISEERPHDVWRVQGLECGSQLHDVATPLI